MDAHNYRNTSTFGKDPRITGNNDWFGGVLSPQGVIYGIPSAATSILRIDPSSDTISFFGSVGTPQGTKWCGGVLAPNGAIYGMPYLLSQVLKIDPAESSAYTLAARYTPGPFGADFNGGVLSPRGIIYAMPFHMIE